MTAGNLQPEPTRPELSPRRPPLPGSMMQMRGEWIEFYDAQWNRLVRFLASGQLSEVMTRYL
jgi:hypothetical protein